MSFARSLATLAGLTVVSRVGGFVRDTLTAMYLGAGDVADAFFVAQRLPNLFRSLFAEGAFSAAFVPLYTIEQEKHGTEAAQQFAGQALAMLMAVLVPFSGLIMLFMPDVMKVMTHGWVDHYPDKYQLAVSFSLITFPYLTLISITALQSGVLNAQNRFGPGAAAPIALNIVMVFGIVVAKIFDLPMGHALSWALTISGAVQMVWLAISCWRARFSIPFVRPHMTTAVRGLFKNIGPGAIGSGATQVNLFVSTMIASSLSTGAISWLYYADRLNQLPLGIVGIAVGTALLPTLSRHVTNGREDQVKHYMSRAIEFCLILGLPAMIGLGIAGRPIIQTLWEHNRFGSADTQATAGALAVYALNIPGFLLIKVFSADFFARQDTRTPVKTAFIAMAVNVTGALTMVGPLGHIGIALATSIATWVNAILLFILLRRRQGPVGDKALRRRIPRIILSSVVMAGLTWGLVRATGGLMATHRLVPEITALVLTVGGASLGYGILLQLTGAVHVREILDILKTRAAKKGLSSPQDPA